jgi:hypothetical protein
MLAGSEDPYRPSARPVDIEDVLERAWLGVTQYSRDSKK